MTQGNADSAPESDTRRLLDALLATAVGTLAGIVADSGFGVRDSIVNAVYRLLGSLFDLFSAFPISQLVAARFIDRIPIVLIVGLALGMILRYIRYPRLLLASVLVWPACLVGRLLMLPQGSIVPDIAGYLMQYGFLILVIRATDAVLARSARRRGAAATSDPLTRT